MNHREAEAMVEAAKVVGRTLGVAYYRRLYPKVQRARQLLEQGVMGRPVLAYAFCHSWFIASDGNRAWLQPRQGRRRAAWRAYSIRMFPEPVCKSSRNPPCPTLPCNSPRPTVPWMVIECSDEMLPEFV